MSEKATVSTDAIYLRAFVEYQLRAFVLEATEDIDHFLDAIGSLISERDNLAFWKVRQRKLLGLAISNRERMCTWLILYRSDAERFIASSDSDNAKKVLEWIEWVSVLVRRGHPLTDGCLHLLLMAEPALQRLIIMELPQ